MQKSEVKFNGFSSTWMYDMGISNDITYEDLPLLKIINENMNINKYSNKTKKFSFIYMAINPDTRSFRPDKKIMRRANPILQLFMNVPDYDKFRKSTKTEARKIIAKLYLTGIKKYLSKQKDFNDELFYNDVKKVFENNGILQDAN